MKGTGHENLNRAEYLGDSWNDPTDIKLWLQLLIILGWFTDDIY